MQNNNSTFKPELQQVKNIKTVMIDNVYHIYATRIDNRPTCCHNHKMQIKDYRVVNILLPSYQGKKVILHLKKQRYKCRHCNKTITSQISEVEKHSNISTKVKQQIQEKLKQIKSFKQIAKEEKVSINTVIRIIDNMQVQAKQDMDTSIIYSVKLANTLINWKQEIINIIKYKINNGYVEGYNNKIKVIKRVSFGLRNYERFRKLIYLRI